MSALPTNPFAFKSAALETSAIKSTIKVGADGSTTTNLGNNTALPSGAAMFESLAKDDQDKTKSVPSKSVSPAQFRDNDNDDDCDEDNNTTRLPYGDADNFNHNHQLDNNTDTSTGFDVFKAAQDQVDQNLFKKAFQQLDVNTIQEQRAAIDNEKKETLQDSLQDDSFGLDSDWLTFLNAFDQEVAKVEDDIRKQQEIEIENSIALIGEAIQNKTTISLPTQSAHSKELTDHLTQLYAQFNEKRKTKEAQRQQRKHNINNTVGIKPLPGTSEASRASKNKKAANKAMNRFDRFDALNELTPQERANQKRRQGNGQIDFLNDNSGPYRKQSQANKKKGKKLDW